MQLMVIGSGGREHAIVKALKKNEDVSEIFVLPGNGGIAQDATCVDIAATDIEGIVAFAKSHDIDFAVVTPDDPLVLGTVDALEAEGVPCFGPDKRAAIIEGSKVFSKDLMKKYGIPTASYEVFDSAQDALSYLSTAVYPIVIKADGLALGKGVFVTANREEAETAVQTIMKDKTFGASGNQIVIESYLEGPEVSVLSFTDGETIVPMISSMDHKRAYDRDRGPNTGGMGTIAPNPYYTKEVAERCMEEIFLPTIRAMREENRTFRGCLYFGLMLTKDGPKVIEYNCRFGDPETQVVLPLMESDLLTVMQACRNETLAKTAVTFSDDNACCVVLASEGYPLSYEKGFAVSIDDGLEGELYYAGVAEKDGALQTSGGRVIGITTTAKTLASAIEKAYEQVEKVHFANKYYRTDIGASALQARK